MVWTPEKISRFGVWEHCFVKTFFSTVKTPEFKVRTTFVIKKGCLMLDVTVIIPLVYLGRLLLLRSTNKNNDIFRRHPPGPSLG